MKKEYGGLGVPNVRDLNLVLLGSWIKRYVNLLRMRGNVA
jgi:hypothetical protein